MRHHLHVPAKLGRLPRLSVSRRPALTVRAERNVEVAYSVGSIDAAINEFEKRERSLQQIAQERNLATDRARSVFLVLAVGLGLVLLILAAETVLHPEWFGGH